MLTAGWRDVDQMLNSTQLWALQKRHQPRPMQTVSCLKHLNKYKTDGKTNGKTNSLGYLPTMLFRLARHVLLCCSSDAAVLLWYLMV